MGDNESYAVWEGKISRKATNGNKNTNNNEVGPVCGGGRHCTEMTLLEEMLVLIELSLMVVRVDITREIFNSYVG